MKKNILWISDLDGTLLNKEKQISIGTQDLLNKIISEGEHFTIATARTPATVVEMLKQVKINLPVIVMNGAAIYNLKTEQYEHVVTLENQQVKAINQVLDAYDKNAFIYTIAEHKLVTYYKNFQNEYEKKFYEERQQDPRKVFKQASVPEEAKVVHFAIMGEATIIHAINARLAMIEGLTRVCSRDVYDENTFYLEVYNNNVSKASAIGYLKERYAFNHVICFGDNINDMEMFELAEEKYAVSNAVDEIKQIATAVIGHHHEDGVGKFIENHRKK